MWKSCEKSRANWDKKQGDSHFKIKVAVTLFFLFAAEAYAQPKEYLLTLEETSRLAVLNNFDIQLAQFDARIAQTQKGEAESIYDTVLNGEVGYNRNKLRRASTIGGTKQLDNDYNFGLSQKLPTGTTLEVDMANNRSWTDSSFATLNPSHDSRLGVSLEQELGQNFFGLSDRASVKLSLYDIENASYTSREKIEGHLAQVQKAYWALALSWERLAISQKMLEQAQKLLGLHQEKFKDGLVEKPELLAAEVNHSKRLDEVALAQNDLAVRENALKYLLNLPQEAASLVPANALALDSAEPVLDNTLKTAYTNRYDYQRILNEAKAQNIKLSMEKNSLWPKIDLSVSLTKNGVSADSFHDAAEQITAEDHADLTAGITLSMPLQNTYARSQVKKAELEKAKKILAIKQAERKILVEIVDQVRSLKAFKDVALNSEHTAQLQEEKLKEEEKRFQSGRSDTDTVIRYQEDVLNARWAAAQNKYIYSAALVDLSLKEGTLLSRYWENDQ